MEERNAATIEIAAKKQEIETLKTKLALTEDELASVKKQLEDQPTASADDDGALSMEIETLKSDLEAANAENAALKKELEGVKAAAGTTTKKRGAKSAE